MSFAITIEAKDVLLFDKKAKGTKKCVIKRELKCDDYITCLENNKTILKTHQGPRGGAYQVFTEKVNKISFSSNDDKSLMESTHIHRAQTLEECAGQKC